MQNAGGLTISPSKYYTLCLEILLLRLFLLQQKDLIKWHSQNLSFQKLLR